MDSGQADIEDKSDVVQSRAWLTAFICFLAASLMTGGLLVLIREFSNPVIDLSRVEELFAVPAFTFAPEPVERRQFLAGIVTFPVTLAVAWPLVARLIRRIGRKQLIPQLWAVGTCAPLVLLGIAGYGIAADPYLVKDITRGAVLVSLVGAAVLVLLLRSGRPVPKPAGYAADIATALLIVLVSAYSLFGIGAVTDTPAYNVHFNTVFHAMVQVFNGKELLVDLTSQYGLFPHFLEPLFRVTDLTVLSFTIMMALLTAVSYGLIYRILKHELGASPLTSLNCSKKLRPISAKRSCASGRWKNYTRKIRRSNS